MLTYLRYALATVCFAASVGCLALWWRSYSVHDLVDGPISMGAVICFESVSGSAVITTWRDQNPITVRNNWRYWYALLPEKTKTGATIKVWTDNFGTDSEGVYFPLWYPVLTFGLAGAAAWRLGRRFTLRSAIIATSVLAGLLGMAVGL